MIGSPVFTDAGNREMLGGDMLMETKKTIPADTAAPAAARRFLRGYPGVQPCTSLAELAISELVSNVIRHSPAVAEIEVKVSADDSGTVHVGVSQIDGTAPLSLGMARTWPAATQLNGRGLRIVDSITRGWGITAGVTIVVWFDIACRPH